MQHLDMSSSRDRYKYGVSGPVRLVDRPPRLHLLYAMDRPSKMRQMFARVRSKFVGTDATLRPCRLLTQDLSKFIQRWPSDWTTFNSVVLASSVFIFFTNVCL